MKLLLFLFIPFVSTLPVAAQIVLVEDKEQLFTTGEIQRIDSMLQQFHQRTGYYVLLSTDSADINAKSYHNSLFELYFPDSSSTNFVLMLLMNRKHSNINIRFSKNLMSDISERDLIEMLNAGLPSFQQRKRAEGATLILQKAMEYLERRTPRKN